jgi:hypothetical protein
MPADEIPAICSCKVRRSFPCSLGRNSLQASAKFPVRRGGNWRHNLDFSQQFAARLHQRAADFAKFPVNFPVLREFGLSDER